MGGEAHHSLEQPLAEPAPSQAEGVVGTALSGDGAGTSPAGVAAGAEASQPTKAEQIRAAYRRAKGNALRAPNGTFAKLADEFDCSESWIKKALFEQADLQPKKKPGREPTFTEAQCRALRAEWLAAKAIDHRAPWAALKAKELGVNINTIRRAIDSVKHLQPLPMPKKSAAEPESPPQHNPAPAEYEPRAVAPRVETETRVHTNSHACWCRQSPCNTKNPWCAIAKPSKPVPSLAGLRDPRPRAERFATRRMHGTYGGEE